MSKKAKLESLKALDVTNISNALTINDTEIEHVEIADSLEATPQSESKTAHTTAHKALIPVITDKRGNVTESTLNATYDAALEAIRAQAVTIERCPISAIPVIGSDGVGYYVGVTNPKLPDGLPMNPANNTFLPGFERASGKRTKPLNVNTARCQAYLYAYRTALALAGFEPIDFMGDKRVCATLIAGGYLVPVDENAAIEAGPNMQRGAPPVRKLVFPADDADGNDTTYTINIYRQAT